jgi:hypothetical protein
VDRREIDRFDTASNDLGTMFGWIRLLQRVPDLPLKKIVLICWSEKEF